jgi:23S rRNA (pseudouridine1915-N3)-methyltransferase
VKLSIVALGHKMPTWVGAGYADYASRLPRDWPLDLLELKPEPRDRGRTVPQLLAAEARRLDAACAGATIVALDEQGSAWTTRDLAGHLERWRASIASLAFVIGSADGLDPGFKRRAASRFSLSALTLPHGLVRVVLAEQIYRAASILTNHPYHRE